MSAYQHWSAQRERLREALQNTTDAAGATQATRHAVAQVEQNTMADQPDDLLRQQTGILFSCVKGSLNLLDIAIITRVWEVRSQTAMPNEHKGWRWLLVLALSFPLAVGVYGYVQHMTLLWICMLLSAAVTLGAVWMASKKPKAPESMDTVNVTAKPDADKLFAAIDAQMKAIDRYILDFSYLNEQNALHQSGELQHATLLSELMQAIGECEGEAVMDAQETAERLLLSMGARAIPYAPEHARLFTVLPSLGEDRTITPALVSQRDGALLAHGVAAVHQASPIPSQEESQ